MLFSGMETYLAKDRKCWNRIVVFYKLVRKFEVHEIWAVVEGA